MSDVEEKSTLYIDKLVLYNYGKYVGKNTLELSPTVDKPITIIHGNNKHGKTTILNAIIWALYGRQKGGNMNTDEGIMNKHIIEKLQEGQIGEAYVELWLYDNDGPQYHIKRILVATKTTELQKREMSIKNEARANQGVSFELKLLAYYRPRGKNQLELVENESSAQDMISRIFPEKLSSYILFDAELLDEFLTQVDKDLVKKGIEEISGLPLIDQVANNLDVVQKKIRKKLKKDMRLEELEDEREYLEKMESEMRLKEKKCAWKIDEIDRQDEMCHEFLEKYTETRINDKQEQLKRIGLEKKILDEQMKNLREELKDFILSNYYKLNLRSEFDNVLQKFQEWERKGRIPPPINSAALDKMINSPPSECVCGRIIEEGSPEMEKIKLARKKIIDSVIIQEINRGRDRLSIMLENSTNEKIRMLYESFVNKLVTCEEQYRVKKTEEKSVLEYLEMYPVDDIKEKTEILKKNNDDRTKIGMDYNAVRAKIREVEGKLTAIRKQIKLAAMGKENNENIIKQTDLCVLAISTFHTLKEELLEDFKRKTAETTSKYFLEITSDDDFGAVEISDGFKLKVVDKNGLSKKLSAGQSHCLGLSYISAIRKITRQNYFIVIDSPLHNISQKERLELIYYLPRYLKTQLTLLVTDTEYTAKTQKNIEGPQSKSVRDVIIKNNTLWKEYLLDEVKDSHGNIGTKIVEVSSVG